MNAPGVHTLSDDDNGLGLGLPIWSWIIEHNQGQVIAVWNTRYFDLARAELRRQGLAIADDVWSHLSPRQWSHIHLNGSHHFTTIRLKGDFCPLRPYQGPGILDPQAMPPADAPVAVMVPHNSTCLERAL
jgi:hypothetical protein